MDTVFKLQDILSKAVEEAGVGVCDGNEMGLNVDEVRFFFYGPNADAIGKAIIPILSQLPKSVLCLIDKSPSARAN
ncbi:MAG: hypothetical protein HYW33_00250 [Candidatus Blackburnbacteria bacterium]|nr:hypothetical protein [Candidatus Blackburnbacteria bacterium]